MLDREYTFNNQPIDLVNQSPYDDLGGSPEIPQRFSSESRQVGYISKIRRSQVWKSPLDVLGPYLIWICEVIIDVKLDSEVGQSLQ